VLVLFGGLILVSLVVVIGAIWHQFRKSDIEGFLKRDMIARGMSADEIERVLAARIGPPKRNVITMRFGTKGPTPADKQTMPYSEPKPN
jgi:hypothetical protein